MLIHVFKVVIGAGSNIQRATMNSSASDMPGANASYSLSSAQTGPQFVPYDARLPNPFAGQPRKGD